MLFVVVTVYCYVLCTFLMPTEYFKLKKKKKLKNTFSLTHILKTLVRSGIKFIWSHMIHTLIAQSTNSVNKFKPLRLSCDQYLNKKNLKKSLKKIWFISNLSGNWTTVIALYLFVFVFACSLQEQINRKSVFLPL